MAYEIQLAAGVNGPDGVLPDGATATVKDASGVLVVTFSNGDRWWYPPHAWVSLKTTSTQATIAAPSTQGPRLGGRREPLEGF